MNSFQAAEPSASHSTGSPAIGARPSETCPVIVIGGGPGGSAAATYLARAGVKVLLLEKEKFPRFHIGESLLPYNRRIFEEMGVLPELEAAGFPAKFGAQFHIGNGSKCRNFVFREGIFTRETAAFQVERATFDHILLRHAAKCGAEVREGWSVTRVSCGESGVQLEAVDADRQPRALGAAYVVDASGRANLTGNQFGLRRLHPHLKKLALFGHFKNVAVDPGEKAGDTRIVRMARKWFWLIPLPGGKVSVGCVLDQADFQKMTKTPAEAFQELWQNSPVMRERMKDAQPVQPIQATHDFSYYNQSFVSPGVFRVGDAAGFMDPIFSAGVFLAMHSGRLAAGAIQKIMAGKRPGPAQRRYDKTLRRQMSAYWRMVDHFYTSSFLDLFFEPREKFWMASAVNAVLAGELDGGWNLRWRMELFFFLIWLQQRKPFVPAVDLREETAANRGV